MATLFGSPAERDFDVRYWDGTVEAAGNGAAPFTLVFKEPSALRQMLLPPTELAIVEAYLAGVVDVEGELSAAVGLGDLERVILEILEIAENELRTVSLQDLRRGIAASIACRAAIKINTPLDQRKMEWLLRSLAATEYPMACPHGRPVALQYGTREILRAFHRI